MRKRINTLFFLLVVPFIVVGSNFEGKIKMVKKTYYDTTSYYYYVKNNMVRIDEYNNYNRLINSIILDLNQNKIYALNASNKVYKEIKPEYNSHSEETDYEVIKTNNTKMINGYLCFQWRVRNKEKKSEIAYWVTKNNFFFFEAVIKIINNIGNCSDFYLHIPENKGFLPILTVERNLVRYEKLRLIVTRIEQQKLDENIFTIPSDYSRFDN